MEPWQQLARSPDQYSQVKYNDPRLDAFAHVVEQHYNLPFGVLEAIKNAGERTNTNQVSPAGAKGVMQFVDKTRALYPHDPSNPFASIDAAGRYVSDLMQRYNGDVRAALTEYNGGVVQANHVAQGGNPTADETKQYLQRIQQYMESKYGNGGTNNVAMATE